MAVASTSKAVAVPTEDEEVEVIQVGRTFPWKILGAALAVLTVLIGGGIYWFFQPHNTGKLKDRDTVVLADFSNSTQDTVFDDTP